MTLEQLAQDAGFIVNPVGEIVVPAPGCDARPYLDKMVKLLKLHAMSVVCPDDGFMDDWDRGYNAGATSAAGQIGLFCEPAYRKTT